MGKSRKANAKRTIDTRGYGQSTAKSTGTRTASSTAATSTPEVTTSSKSSSLPIDKHENIKQLTEQLRNIEIQQRGDTGESPSISVHNTTSTVSSDRFVTRLKSIVNRLIDLDFTESQLDLVAQHLGYDITLEAALDYLCLNVPTLELPPLFTDGKLRDSLRRANNGGNDKKDSNTLTVLKFATQEQDSEELDEIEKADADDDEGERKQNVHEFYLKHQSPKTEDLTEVRDAADRKAWLLQMYGDYQNDNSDEDDVTISNSKADGDSVNRERQTHEEVLSVNDTDTDITAAAVVSAEEMGLQLKERKLQELQDDVNNEANNYMRSKNEIKQLKQQCSILKKEIAGLRRKIEKIKREKAESSAVMPSATLGSFLSLDHDDTGEQAIPVNFFGDGKEEDQSEDGGSHLFDIFGENGGVKDHAWTTASTEVSTNISHAGEKSSESARTSLIDCSIPKTWTGTTPKKVLEETCKKKKLVQPKFTRLPSKSGYRLSVSTSKKAKASEWIALTTNFRSNGSLQDYLAAQALYAIDPTMPIYLMFPPSFKLIWQLWQAEEKEEKNALKDEEGRTDSERILRLLSLIKDKSVMSHPAMGKIQSIIDSELEYDQTAPDDTWEDRSIEDDHVKPIRTAGADAQRMRDEFTQCLESPKYLGMLQYRNGLPMAGFRDQFLQTVEAHPVTILCAETGAGKTTQCPQYILEDSILKGKGDSVNILCTQPRRVAAVSVAERVADEMQSKLGKEVGYQIRMESKKSASTRLLFCTTGVCLRRLQNDNDLAGVTHIIVDECHERQVEVDVLLIALRHIIHTSRRDLKIILMSASIDPTIFSDFFGGAPVLSVPGRTFEVSTYYLEDLFDATGHIIEEGSPYAVRTFNKRHRNTTTLWVTTNGGEKRQETVDDDCWKQSAEHLPITYAHCSLSVRLSMERVDEAIINYDLIEDVLEHICIERVEDRLLVAPTGAKDDGAVLCFLPGVGEIRTLSSRLASNRHFSNPSRFSIIPLHSKLSSAEQRKAFLPSKPGCRKIIVATNVAETSLTIPDVVVVIDSGRERELRRHHRTSTSVLVTDWISKASAKQRKGRAGRVQPGICLKLYSSETAKAMKPSTEPELRRVSLEQVCLLVLSSRGFGDCQSFLRKAPQPPKDDSIELALVALQEVGAITSNGKSLTPLGEHLARLPVDVRIGKLLIIGTLFNCLDNALTIAACLSSKSPFPSYFEGADMAKAKHAVWKDPDSGSDFITLCNVWEGFSTASGGTYAFCKANHLDHAALSDISIARKEFLIQLCSIGLVSRSEAGAYGSGAWNTCSVNVNSKKWPVVHAVCCAGLSPNFAKLDTSGSLPSLYHNQQELVFHRSSINFNRKRFPSDQQFLVFNDKFGTAGRVSVSVTCFVSSLPLLLFGQSVKVEHTKRLVVVDKWLQIHMPAQSAVTLLQLRLRIDNLLERLVRSPDRVDTHLMNEIAQILQ